MTPQCKTSLLAAFPSKRPLLIQQEHHQDGRNKRKSAESIRKSADNMRKIKCVIVGDKAVGKTSLAVSYSNDSFPSEYVPTAFDNYNVQVQVNGKPVRVELGDTAGEDGLDQLRHLCYPGTDVFMLCFSIVEPSSFFSACTRWADEIVKNSSAAVVLVGTQSDLRSNPQTLERLKLNGQRPVSASEAKGLAERLNAPYVETSAKACTQLKEAFDVAIVMALKMQKKRKKRRLLRKLWCCGR